MQKEQLEQLKNETNKTKAEPDAALAGLKPTEKQKSGKIFLKKKNVILGLIGLVIIAGGAYFYPKIFKKAPKTIYEAAIMVRSQQASDPAEDARSSLKAGDALVIQKDGHKWSNTEKISYLILKMNLTENQKQKLTQAKEKEIKFKDLPQEEQDRINEDKKRAKEAGEEYMEEPRRETLIAREYYIDLIKHFPDFSAVDLLNGQPYLDEVYDWGVVNRKK